MRSKTELHPMKNTYEEYLPDRHGGCTLQSTIERLTKILNCTPARSMYSCEYFKPLSIERQRDRDTGRQGGGDRDRKEEKIKLNSDASLENQQFKERDGQCEMDKEWYVERPAMIERSRTHCCPWQGGPHRASCRRLLLLCSGRRRR